MYFEIETKLATQSGEISTRSVKNITTKMNLENHVGIVVGFDLKGTHAMHFISLFLRKTSLKK